MNKTLRRSVLSSYDRTCRLNIHTQVLKLLQGLFKGDKTPSARWFIEGFHTQCCVYDQFQAQVMVKAAAVDLHLCYRRKSRKMSSKKSENRLRGKHKTIIFPCVAVFDSHLKKKIKLCLKRCMLWKSCCCHTCPVKSFKLLKIWTLNG